MNSPNPQIHRGRPNTKLKEVISRLRDSILSGEYAPSSRLQTYRELEVALDVSRATLRHAIGVLKREGFIESTERSGMCVSPTPPHILRIGLIFHDPRVNDRFQQALLHVADEINQSGGLEIVKFCGIHPGSKHPDWELLSKDLASHRLMGLILPCPCEFLEGTGALEDETLPKISFRSFPEPGCHRVILDNKSLADQAIDWFLSQGRRKIALIGIGSTPMPGMMELGELFSQSCMERGLPARPEWCISIGLDYPKGAQNIAHLLGTLPANIRPDALLINNDNTVPYACAGLVAAQIQVPQDFAVAVHCCWPWPVPNVLPLTRIGFDVRKILKQAMQMIRAKRNGEAVCDIVLRAELFDNQPDTMGIATLVADRNYDVAGSSMPI